MENHPDSEVSSRHFLSDQDKAESFSNHFSEIRGELSAYLISRTGGDVSIAEDCLQEIAIVLWNKHESHWKRQDYQCSAYRCASIEFQAHFRKIGKLNKHLTYLAPETVEALSAGVLEYEQENGSDPKRQLKATARNYC